MLQSGTCVLHFFCRSAVFPEDEYNVSLSRTPFLNFALESIDYCWTCLPCYHSLKTKSLLSNSALRSAMFHHHILQERFTKLHFFLLNNEAHFRLVDLFFDVCLHDTIATNSNNHAAVKICTIPNLRRNRLRFKHNTLCAFTYVVTLLIPIVTQRQGWRNLHLQMPESLQVTGMHNTATTFLLHG